MTQTKTLFVIGCLFAVAVAWHLLPTRIQAGAEPPKGRQKWEYATLIEANPPAPASYSLIWRTGKTRLVAQSKDPQVALSALIKELGGEALGGKDERSPVGVLLDQIGQDGWELVTHLPRLVQQR
jgi:hypothetical protein